MDDNTLDNLTLQQQEIEMLQAMFPGPKELVWHDPTLLIDMEEYINSGGRSPEYVRSLSFEMNLEAIAGEEPGCKVCFCLSVLLPQSYPHVEPSVSVKCNQSSRSQLSELNADLRRYISNLNLGEMMILDIVTWLQESVTQLQVVSSSSSGDDKLEAEVQKTEPLICMWLYMHHIYNKEKRKDIINWANDLGLTGFSLPGKPGVVHVEGDSRNVDEYFERLRRLTWKRMSCKVKEPRPGGRIFEDFEELVFDVHGGRDYHMDLGKFFLYLKGKGLGHMFKELFGLEGHG